MHTAIFFQTFLLSIRSTDKGNYRLSVKSNQPCLYQDIGEYVNDNELRDKMNCDEASEKNRNRFKPRTAYTTTDIDWLDQKEDWENCFEPH